MRGDTHPCHLRSRLRLYFWFFKTPDMRLVVAFPPISPLEGPWLPLQVPPHTPVSPREADNS